MLVLLMGAAAYMTFCERVVHGADAAAPRPQSRRAHLGLLQPIADGIKLLTKERFQPARCRNIHLLACPRHFPVHWLCLSLC